MIGIPEMIAYFPRERMTGQALTMKSIFLRHYERSDNPFFSFLSLRGEAKSPLFSLLSLEAFAFVFCERGNLSLSILSFKEPLK